MMFTKFNNAGEVHKIIEKVDFHTDGGAAVECIRKPSQAADKGGPHAALGPPYRNRLHKPWFAALRPS
jgi:hypothetical protein